MTLTHFNRCIYKYIYSPHLLVKSFTEFLTVKAKAHSYNTRQAARLYILLEDIKLVFFYLQRFITLELLFKFSKNYLWSVFGFVLSNTLKHSFLIYS